MKLLNLYAGLGGNRKLWIGHDVTAVEMCPEIAAAYQRHFPNDQVVVGDAHAYLLNHYEEFDCVWSSPPCQSHGQYRYNVGVVAKGYKALYPDMKLYQEIIFLRHHFKGVWVVENVRPYYTPLVPPTKVLGRHLFWSNFPIGDLEVGPANIRYKSKIGDFDTFDVTGTKIPNKRQALRNCVDPELGKWVMSFAPSEENLLEGLV